MTQEKPYVAGAGSGLWMLPLNAVTVLFGVATPPPRRPKRYHITDQMRLPLGTLVVASVIAVSACSANGQAEPCATGQCVPIPSGEITLAAEIDLPPGPGPHPLLVMIHGSGPGTRQDFAAVVDTYRSIGIGILRYDKRGSGESTGRFRDVTAANSIEVFSIRNFESNSVPSQEKILIPVGTAISRVVTIIGTRSQANIPATNMWWAQTAKASTTIPNRASAISR